MPTVLLPTVRPGNHDRGFKSTGIYSSFLVVNRKFQNNREQFCIAKQHIRNIKKGGFKCATKEQRFGRRSSLFFSTLTPIAVATHELFADCQQPSRYLSRSQYTAMLTPFGQRPSLPVSSLSSKTKIVVCVGTSNRVGRKSAHRSEVRDLEPQYAFFCISSTSWTS